MGTPLNQASQYSQSKGPTLKLVTVSSISSDGSMALCTDRSGVQYNAPMLTQPGKGALPVVGDNWYLSNSSGYWLFSTFIGTSTSQFPEPGGGSGGGTPTPPSGPASSALAVYAYKGTPGAGNSPAAYISTAAEDPFGNLVEALAAFGITSKIQIGPDGSINIFDASGNLAGVIAPSTGSYSEGFNLFRMPLLCYSGPPASGNLVLSIAGTAGEDKFGNPYPKGFSTTAGTVPGAIVSGTVPGSTVPIGSGSVLNYNPYFTNGDLSGWVAYSQPLGATIAPAQVPKGPYPWSAQLVSNSTGGASLEGQTYPFQISLNTQYLVTCWVYVNAAGSHSIFVGMDFLNGPVANTDYVSTVASSVNVPGNTWTPISVVVTSPTSGVTYAYPRCGPNTSTGPGMQTFIQALLVLPQIPGGLIQVGTITAGQIAAGTITAAQLAAGIVVAGIVNATTIQAATLIGSTILGYTSLTPRGPYYQSFETQPVQISSNQAVTNSLTVTLPNPTTAGNCLVACIVSGNVTVSGVTLGGSADNWAQAVTTTDPQPNAYFIWTDQNCAGGQTSVVVNVSTSHQTSVIVYELAGVSLSGAVDKTAVGSGSGATTWTTATTATTSQATEYAIGMVGMYGGSLPSISEVNYNDIQVSWGGTGVLQAGFDILTNTQTVNYSGTNTPSNTEWGALVITLKKTAGGSFGWSTNAYASSVAQSGDWSSQGLCSLKVIASGSGPPGTYAPSLPCTGLDAISLSADIYVPVTLPQIQIGVDYYNVSTYLSTTTTTPVSLTGGTYITIELTDNAPATATRFQPWAQDANTDAVNTLLYVDNFTSAGNLAFSAAAAGGTDAVGNTYNQGIQVVDLPGLTSAFSVTDPFGNALAKIDAAGNVTGQTVTANTDLILAGQSMVNTILPDLPQGILNFGYITYGTLPFPTTAFTVNPPGTTLFELDATINPNRVSKIVVTPHLCTMNNTGGQVVYDLRYTTDGSTPSTSSTLALTAASGPKSLTGGFADHNGLTYYFNTLGAGSNTIYRFVICGYTIGTGDTAQIATPVFVTIEDVGVATPQTSNQNLTLLGTGGGGGVSKQTYTTSYAATATYSYYGTNAGGQKRNTNGSMYQGVYSGGYGVDGSQFSYMHFNSSAISSALSGATINWVTLKLVNQHFWYDSGGSVMVGYSTRGSFPASFGSWPQGGDTANVNQQHYNEGQNKTITLPGSFGTAFQSGGAQCIILGNNSTQNLTFYGYFQGGGSPVLTFNYTK